MKFKFYSIAALALAITLIWIPCASSKDNIVLRMNHQQTGREPGAKVDKWFVEEVAKRTNGAVKIQIFWAEALGKAKETLGLLKEGGIDMAGLSPGYFPAELPFFTAPNSLPMAMDNIQQAQLIMHTLLTENPEFMQEADANKVRPLFFHVLNPYLLISKEPVRKFEDLKGKKIRTWGEDMPKLAKAAGMTPVTMFMPELYEGLMRGVIDCAPFSVDNIVTYKLQEVAKYITEVVLWEGPTWGVWISSKAWDKLPADAQKIIMEVVEEAKKMDLKEVGQSADTSRATLKEAGVEFIPFPDSELKKWQDANPDFFESWIAKMEKLGKGAAAKDVVKTWKKLRAEN